MAKRSGTLWSRVLPLGLAACMGLGLGSGCMDDPQDPKTWVKKLDDIREQKDAIRNLVKLKDAPGIEQAVGPLTTLFKRTRDPEHLKAIAKLRNDQSVDLFIEQLDYSDENFENAAVAATGLLEIAQRDDRGREAAKKAVPELVKALGKKLPIKTRANIVKIEAMKAATEIRDPAAVPALNAILETSADEQDFFLNKQAARHLAEFADASSVPALVHGMFMVGRGSDIFTDCRVALARIGEPAADKLIEVLQHKDAKLEEDAKKFEFPPGLIVQKAAIILADIRSKKSVQPLLTVLAKKDDGLAPGGVSEHQQVLQTLGFIGDPAAVKPVLAVLNDAKRVPKHRAAAAEAMNILGATEGLPTMLALSKTQFLKPPKEKDELPELDPEKATLASQAVTQYSRLTDKDESAAVEAIGKGIPADIVDIRKIFENAVDRIKVAKECGKDVGCNGKMLNDANPAKAERAAFSLSRAGKDALPVLIKNVGHKDPATRSGVLFALSRIATKADQEVLKALNAQIDIDKTKDKAGQALADEMRVTAAIISHR